MMIFYTTDGAEPDSHSNKYTGPFQMDKGEIKAIAIINGEKGGVCEKRFGLIKQGWQLLDVPEEDTIHACKKGIDEDSYTYWRSKTGTAPYCFAISLGKEEDISGFGYTPQRENSEGMIEEGIFQISNDGKNWKDVTTFIFGNLINDPTQRFLFLKDSVKASYVRIVANRIAGDGHYASIAELDLY
jgi:alpha-L-fucosidase